MCQINGDFFDRSGFGLRGGGSYLGRGVWILADLTGFFPLGVCGVADCLFLQMGVALPPLIGATACPIPRSTRSTNMLEPWIVM